MKRWMLVVFLFIFCFSVFAIDTDMNILKVSCWNTGKLRLIVDSSGYIIDADTIETKATFLDENEYEEEVPAFYFPLIASEKYIISDENITLESNEAVFNWSGTYRLSVSYDKEGEMIKFPYNVICPGLLISCKAAKLEIRDCLNKEDGSFEAIIIASGLNILEGTDQIENVEFFIEAEKSYEDIDGEFSTSGGLANSFEIEDQSSNIYIVSGNFSDNNVKSITASFKYNDCEKTDKKICDETEDSSLITGAATTEVTGEMSSELEQKRQEVADIVKQNVEAYEQGFDYTWLILIMVLVAILATGMYILIKRKANKKPNFVKF